MKAGFTLSICGLSIRFNIYSALMFKRLKKHYSAYFAKPDRFSFIVNCRFQQKPFGRQSIATMRKEKDGQWRAIRKDFFCRWSGSGGEAACNLSIASFDSMIRVLFSTEMPARGGLLIHGAAVVEKGNAILFTGPSGTGKSTIAGFSDGRNVLSDEIIGLRINRYGKVVVSATPFWGELGSGRYFKKNYPLKEIIFPEKSEVIEKVFLKRRTIPGKLMRNVCIFSRDPAQYLEIMNLVALISKKVPASIMQFRKNGEFWEVI